MRPLVWREVDRGAARCNEIFHQVRKVVLIRPRQTGFGSVDERADAGVHRRKYSNVQYICHASLAKQVTAAGFGIVFRTWGDTRVVRIRAERIAFGALSDEDDWDVV